MTSPTDSQTPESRRLRKHIEQIVIDGLLDTELKPGKYKPFLYSYPKSSIDKLETLITAEVLAAQKALLPEEDTRKHAVKGVDQGIQLGWNMAIDQMRRNFKGDSNG